MLLATVCALVDLRRRRMWRRPRPRYVNQMSAREINCFCRRVVMRRGGCDGNSADCMLFYRTRQYCVTHVHSRRLTSVWDLRAYERISLRVFSGEEFSPSDVCKKRWREGRQGIWKTFGIHRKSGHGNANTPAQSVILPMPVKKVCYQTHMGRKSKTAS